MTLAVDKTPERFTGDFHDLLAVGADIIYAGALIGIDGSGYAAPLIGTHTVFAGVAEEHVDMTGLASGAKRVKVRRGWQYRRYAVTGVTGLTDVGTAVYASADDTLTLTSTSNKLVGVVAQWFSGTECMVLLKPDI